MRPTGPFTRQDLVELDERLLDKALAVVAMESVAGGQMWPQVIGLRHDVDDNTSSLETAVRFAEWEADRGFRATFFILHTAAYWQDKDNLMRCLDRIGEFGQEVALHNDCISAAIVSGRDPLEILEEATDELRSYGFRVSGTVAHGNGMCRENGIVRYVNDEVFTECARPTIGEPERSVAGVNISPVPMSSFGFEYDANWLPKAAYLSDSGRSWSDPGFDATAESFPFDGQLHMLVHPDWWPQAFAPEEIAA